MPNHTNKIIYHNPIVNNLKLPNKIYNIPTPIYPKQQINQINPSLPHDKDLDLQNDQPSNPSCILKISRKPKDYLNNKLNIIHFNSNGIKNKETILKIFIEQQRPQILSLNEIRCDEPTANNALRFYKYSTYYKRRINKNVKKIRGGGAVLLIDESIDQEEIAIPF